MGMFDQMGKMKEMMDKARELQAEIKKARYELTYEGVRVVINGEMEIAELILPEKVQPQAIREAVNRCLKTAKADMAEKMKRVTGGLQLPGA